MTAILIRVQAVMTGPRGEASQVRVRIVLASALVPVMNSDPANWQDVENETWHPHSSLHDYSSYLLV